MWGTILEEENISKDSIDFKGQAGDGWDFPNLTSAPVKGEPALVGDV